MATKQENKAQIDNNIKKLLKYIELILNGFFFDISLKIQKKATGSNTKIIIHEKVKLIEPSLIVKNFKGTNKNARKTNLSIKLKLCDSARKLIRVRSN